jgi:predicted nucleotidyltransferase
LDEDFGKRMSETKQLPIAIPKEEIAQFCQRHHIRKLSLFGSVLRDDFTPESDINLDFIWQTVTEDLVPLIAELEKVLSAG